MNVPKVYCPYCRLPYRQIKWGRTPAGSQKYRCHHCERVYTPAPRTRGHPPDVRKAAVDMHLNGHNYRQIGQHLGVHHQSVINWVNRYRYETGRKDAEKPEQTTSFLL